MKCLSLIQPWATLILKRGQMVRDPQLANALPRHSGDPRQRPRPVPGEETPPLRSRNRRPHCYSHSSAV